MTATPNTLPKDAGEWFQWVQSRLRVLERHRHGGEDTYNTVGDVILSVASGFTIDDIHARVSGSVVMISGAVTRTGATIAGNTSGDIGNTTIANLQPGFWPFWTASVTSASTGSLAHFVVYNDGTFQVVSLAPNNAWATGTMFTFAGTWIMADNTT